MLEMLLQRPYARSKSALWMFFILLAVIGAYPVCAADGGQSAYEYDLSGRRTKWTLPNGVTAFYNYGINDRLIELTVRKGDETLDRYTYSYDPTGRCTGIAYADGSQSVYTFDRAYRLTGDKRIDANGGLIYEETFTYDAVGNRLSKRRTGLNPESVDYVYNARNQLVSSSDGKTYTYDANGNCISIASPGGVITMTYDVLNRLTGYSGPNGSEQITYRGAGWHKWGISETGIDGNTAITGFLYDGNNVVADYAGSERRLSRLYATAGIDRNISMTVVNGPNPGNYYYTHDGLGSVRTLTDGAGVVQNRYDYTAFGEPIPGMPENIPQRYGYTGRENNAIAGDMHYRNRNYTPAIGRFDRRDPIGYIAGSNLYSYVDNEPNVYTDPFGLIVKIDGSQTFTDDIIKFLKMGCPEAVLEGNEVKMPCPVHPMTLACSELFDAINDKRYTLTYRSGEPGKGNSFKPDSMDGYYRFDAPPPDYKAIAIPNVGSGGTMWMDPKSLMGEYVEERSNTNDTWNPSPPFVGVYHELFHGNESRNGTLIIDDTEGTHDFGPPVGIIPIAPDEVRAFEKEQTVRKNNGIPLRRRYYNHKDDPYLRPFKKPE